MIDIRGSLGQKGLRSEEELGGVRSDLTGYLAFRKWVACAQAWLVAQEWYCVSQVQNARVINGKDERFVFFSFGSFSPSFVGLLLLVQWEGNPSLQGRSPP